MKKINLRYQISLFGNYDEIVPNSENVKFFVENYADKGMIPYQTQEVSIDMASKEPNTKTSQRLSLTDSERKWDIKFNSDRIDIVFVNSNIGVTEMISKENFLQEVIVFLEKINVKFKNPHKRVGFVSQYLFDSADISKSSKLFLDSINYFDEKSILEWSSRIATRAKIEYNNGKDELINVSSESRWINQPMTMNNGFALFQGIALNIDVNTLHENPNYRFQFEDLKSLFGEISKIEEIIATQNIQKIG